MNYGPIVTASLQQTALCQERVGNLYIFAPYDTCQILTIGQAKLQVKTFGS